MPSAKTPGTKPKPQENSKFRKIQSTARDLKTQSLDLWELPWDLELGPWNLRPRPFHLHFAPLRPKYAPRVRAIRSARPLMNRIIDAIEKEQQKSDGTDFNVGDSVRVHTRVVEGDKERVQIFAGIVIGRKGRGLNESFTVRRISYGEGVERVFPLHSPRIAKIEIEQKGRARRAKLNYLRGRKGKEATAVRE
jgi:large subunit ribosomal protein L19